MRVGPPTRLGRCCCRSPRPSRWPPRSSMEEAAAAGARRCQRAAARWICTARHPRAGGRAAQGDDRGRPSSGQGYPVRAHRGQGGWLVGWAPARAAAAETQAAGTRARARPLRVHVQYGLAHISVGDLLRAEVAAGTPGEHPGGTHARGAASPTHARKARALATRCDPPPPTPPHPAAGLKAKSYMDNGDLVPNEVRAARRGAGRRTTASRHPRPCCRPPCAARTPPGRGGDGEEQAGRAPGARAWLAAGRLPPQRGAGRGDRARGHPPRRLPPHQRARRAAGGPCGGAPQVCVSVGGGGAEAGLGGDACPSSMHEERVERAPNKHMRAPLSCLTQRPRHWRDLPPHLQAPPPRGCGPPGARRAAPCVTRSGAHAHPAPSAADHRSSAATTPRTRCGTGCGHTMPTWMRVRQQRWQTSRGGACVRLATRGSRTDCSLPPPPSPPPGLAVISYYQDQKVEVRCCRHACHRMHPEGVGRTTCGGAPDPTTPAGCARACRSMATTAWTMCLPRSWQRWMRCSGTSSCRWRPSHRARHL